ncbi:MAG: hypothetical protein QOD99_2767 [Chthoniobacter sp.]|jgi:hypothetical protein|nr:hypothetical protein [Chthoniobacter sp.]
MKTLLFAISLALLAFPVRHAFADHSPADKLVDSLHDDFKHVLEMRQAYGSSPLIRDELAEANALYQHIREELHGRDEPNDHVRAEAARLRILLERLHAQYHAHARALR